MMHHVVMMVVMTMMSMMRRIREGSACEEEQREPNCDDFAHDSTLTFCDERCDQPGPEHSIAGVGARGEGLRSSPSSRGRPRVFLATIGTLTKERNAFLIRS